MIIRCSTLAMCEAQLLQPNINPDRTIRRHPLIFHPSLQ
jgi:hypothetical protein